MSPIYRYIEINGIVTFQQNASSLHLRANYIFIRAGELRIGNKTNPFQGTAQITLNGNQSDPSKAFQSSIQGGNKIIQNVGVLSLWGIPRVGRSRLLSIVSPQDMSIRVETGLGWVAGDLIGLAPTTLNWWEMDYGVITSYDNTTGSLSLDR